MEYIDKVSLERAQLLHPKVRNIVIAGIQEANRRLTGRAQVRLTQGLRNEGEQNGLYAIGRTKPGKKVTNAKFGQSFHNFGLAFDICLILDGKTVSWDTKADYDSDGVADWMEVVEVFQNLGWVWGGTFKSIVDMPHFEYPVGLSWRECLARYQKKDFIAGTTYIRI